ncbi:unnamed protein product [Staurois parvus]|uniref:Uncharacterized protein n=1 Tax=Staurois parvus TaxID=386267 RepID=A0ABN9FRV0_9NEOB|nr:unnamed protein product [Staurois parvus]
MTGSTAGRHWWVGTGGWHWWTQVGGTGGGTGGWAQVGGTAGHRCVTLQSGTGGCTAGHRWVHCWAQVGDLLGTGGRS